MTALGGLCGPMRGPEDPPPPPPAPLLLLPGVCGTMLAVRRKGEKGDGERCWVDLTGADASYKKLWGRFTGKSKRVELLEAGMEACVPQGPDDSGLYAVSVLDPDVGPTVLSPVKYFEPLIQYLTAKGYTPGLNLFGGGYDFRQSCRDSAARLKSRLEEVSRKAGCARVDVVSHSMGGLVMRSLLADHPKDFERLVGRWVAIGCPFGGAPGYTVDALVTGVCFGGSLGSQFFVKRDTFRQAALQSPSVYELLPPLCFPYAAPPPTLVLWLRDPIQQHGMAQRSMMQHSMTPHSVAQQAAASPALGAAAPAVPPAIIACPHCSGLLQMPGTGVGAGTVPQMTLPGQQQQQQQQQQQVAEHSEQEPPLPCIFHARVTLPSPPLTASGFGTSFSAGMLPSRHSSGSNSGGGFGSSGPRNQATQYTFGHAHLPGLLNRLLQDNTVSVGGASIPLPFDQELWALGQATHESWVTARLPSSCAFYNMHGTGSATPYDVQYGAWWYPLQDLEAVPSSQASYTYVDGDGTVPTESANAHGLELAGSAAISGVAHRDLVASQAVWDQLLAWLGEPAPQQSSSGRIVGGAGAAAARCGGGPGVDCRSLGDSLPAAAWSLAAAAPWQPAQQVLQKQQEQVGAGRQEKEEGDNGCEEFWNPLMWQALLK